MQLLHFAHLRLDTQLLWAEPAAADCRRQASRNTLANIVDHALHRLDASLVPA